MRTSFVIISLLFFSLFFCEKSSAQTQSPSLDDLQRQMLEMQRQLMEQLRNSPFNDPNFAVPQWDTTFFFRLDTTFEGGSMSQFFRFSPFGNDTTMSKGFFDFDKFFDGFFNLDGRYFQPDHDTQDFPQDDGLAPQNEDGLLPEERLRQEGEKGKTEEKQPAPKPAEPKPDPKVKVIRI